MKTVKSPSQLPHGACGWQTEYGTGREAYCAEKATSSGLCPGHERLARDSY
ncbi:hypothetical protein [Nocardiopsis sp. FIRDI 009]|uniref:hypothetical protein n=1 Tax=Nocardiopsis sp. FIRDI 009 TaxID=714197 RepID=UPI00130084E5|nr:hypothetical protein [Nocardiopsis sp. FIRDI 009]